MYIYYICICIKLTNPASTRDPTFREIKTRIEQPPLAGQILEATSNQRRQVQNRRSISLGKFCVSHVVWMGSDIFDRIDPEVQNSIPMCRNTTSTYMCLSKCHKLSISTSFKKGLTSQPPRLSQGTIDSTCSLAISLPKSRGYCAESFRLRPPVLRVKAHGPRKL